MNESIHLYLLGLTTSDKRRIQILYIHMAQLSWSLIVRHFEERYDEVYMHRDVKAHFDFSNEVIDGAKERWRTLILLDAIACCMSKRDPNELR